ncbi:hypothetical protein BCR37DRAFT_115744 [Protomyces lactucae-debilis]|uniref:Rhamnolipids biosynthesis 3-oxoacyl-reductase n=1 Tax=Protomyces lactucae-debilis TaxID=2754530 RepID=A0A1Y2F2X3_PROLT|nr:uncharacterized protein BCR37DRAFT_115744 [Protomyces lactucae-debilis]ORY78193.1 hypothetical protein BCR37DRAFT_115744 [Protomyces lactucae-debilis]
MSYENLDASALFGVEGKSVLVTGGGSGIGYMIARAFISNNAKHVFISSRKKSVCDETCKEFNALGFKGKAIAIPGDLNKRADVERLVSEITKVTGGKLHVVVNNSGNNWAAPFDEFPDAAWDRVLGLNLKSVFVVSQLCTPLLEAAATPDDPGRLIHIGSVDGNRVPIHETFAYSASKAGVQHLSKHLAGHLGPRLITSNTIFCGPFQSAMMKATLEAAGDSIKMGIPLGRIGRASDVGGLCVFLSGKAGSYINGAGIALDGGHLCSSGAYYDAEEAAEAAKEKAKL